MNQFTLFYLYHRYKLVYTFILDSEYKKNCRYASDLCSYMMVYDKYDDAKYLFHHCVSNNCYECRYHINNKVCCDCEIVDCYDNVHKFI